MKPNEEDFSEEDEYVEIRVKVLPEQNEEKMIIVNLNWTLSTFLEVITGATPTELEDAEVVPNWDPESIVVIINGKVISASDKKLHELGFTEQCQIFIRLREVSVPPAGVDESQSRSAGLMQQMDSPIMKMFMENPQFIQSVFESNPALKELRQKNPELNYILSDPALLKESMESARDPKLMQEMMRNTDRAMSNMESTPGGASALHNIYKTVQEPMWEAACTQDSQPEKTKMYDLKTYEPPNCEAMPNPWASQSKPNERFPPASMPGMDLGSILRPSPSSRPDIMPSNLRAPNEALAGLSQLQNPFLQSLREMRNVPNSAQTEQTNTSNQSTSYNPPSQDYTSQLETLAEYGFDNTAHVLEILRVTNGNINRALDMLCREQEDTTGHNMSSKESDQK